MLSDKQQVRDLVNICYDMGIRHVVISPGSRNAPMTISFDNHKGFTCYSIIDERSAAFFALGISQQTRQPTAIVCTSGSATLNYAPAIVEAYYQQVPLLVLTADRPAKLVDIGDGQTMRQEGVYRNYILDSYTITQPANDEDRIANIQTIVRAVNRTKSPIPGPVHINVPLEEPLYNCTEQEDDLPPLEQFLPKENAAFDSSLVLEALAKLSPSPKTLLLLGMIPPSESRRKSIESFVSQHPNVVVLAETTSNISHPRIISQIDRTLAGFLSDNPDDFVPDLLITMGHSIISKHIKKWLRAAPLKAHWHVDPHGHFPDTFHQLSLKVGVSSEAFFPLLETLDAHPEYALQWSEVAQKTSRMHQSFLSDAPFVDLTVYPHILSHLPRNTILQMGNSTVVRYVQLFQNRPDIRYFSNRGVSGIEGCSSTAIGVSNVAKEQLVVLLVGDVSFGYDSNAFWHNHLNANLKIFAFNNEGGSIFRFIEGPDKTDQLESLFVTYRKDTIRHTAQRYALNYACVDNLTDLLQSIPSFLAEKSDRPSILEIKTDGVLGAQVLREYFDNLRRTPDYT